MQEHLWFIKYKATWTHACMHGDTRTIWKSCPEMGYQTELEWPMGSSYFPKKLNWWGLGWILKFIKCLDAKDGEVRKCWCDCLWLITGLDCFTSVHVGRIQTSRMILMYVLVHDFLLFFWPGEIEFPVSKLLSRRNIPLSR